MKQHDARQSIVAQWIDKAEKDYALAEFLLAEDRFLEAACYHCQQAAEKYLKAYLVYTSSKVPRTHILGALLDIIADNDSPLADALSDITGLNPYGTTIRYPDDAIEVSSDEAAQAFQHAKLTRKLILARINAH